MTIPSEHVACVRMHIKIIKKIVKAYPIRKEPQVLATNAGTTTYLLPPILVPGQPFGLLSQIHIMISVHFSLSHSVHIQRCFYVFSPRMTDDYRFEILEKGDDHDVGGDTDVDRRRNFWSGVRSQTQPLFPSSPLSPSCLKGCFSPLIGSMWWPL